MKRKFAWFCILILIVAAIYFLLGKKSAFSLAIPFIQVKSRDIVKKIDKTVTPLSKTAVNALLSGTNKITDLAVEKSEEALRQAVGAAKKEAFNALRGAVEERVDSLGAELGVSVSGSGKGEEKIFEADADIPITFSVNAGSPANFTIKNRNAGKIFYEVDWRDNEKSQGEINVGKSTNVSHIWKTAGEYLLKFKIFNSKEEKIYQISIFVI